MPETDLSLLENAARAAGEIALRYAGGAAQSWDKPDGAGPVTEADLAVNEMLKSDLRAARQDYGWLSEECEDDEDRLAAERVFIIDPIDGTRSFMKGDDTWAHALAIAERGEVIAAAVYLPVLDRMYLAAKGQGATLNGEALTASARRDLSGARVLAAKPSYDGSNWRDGVPDLSRHYRPSLAFRMSLVAQGRFDAMLTLRRSWEWDIAAGDLIGREAGARTSDRTGAPLIFNNARPLLNGVVSAGPNIHGALIDALAQDGPQTDETAPKYS